MWNAGKKVWMRKSETDFFEFIMFVVRYEYNYERQGWDYQLKDEDGNEHPGLVKETNTKKAWFNVALNMFEAKSTFDMRYKFNTKISNRHFRSWVVICLGWIDMQAPSLINLPLKPCIHPHTYLSNRISGAWLANDKAEGWANNSLKRLFIHHYSMVYRINVWYLTWLVIRNFLVPVGYNTKNSGWAECPTAALQISLLARWRKAILSSLPS